MHQNFPVAEKNGSMFYLKLYVNEFYLLKCVTRCSFKTS